MKRNIKKAIAFALATVTVAANLGVSAPVTAAEYSAVKDILPTEYEKYDYFNDGLVFAGRTEVKTSDEESKWYLDELVFVDKNGETSTMEIKNTDGSYKYTNISWVSEDCLAMYYDDDTYALYYADGTWFNNGTERYRDITILDDGNYIVSSDTTCSVVDKAGKVIAKDIFTPVESGYTYWWPNYEFGDYIVLGRNVYTDAGDDIKEIKIFDKNYKQVDAIDFSDCYVTLIANTYLGVYDSKSITLYDTSLKKLDYVYKKDVVTNPSAATDSERVLVDYSISGVWTRYDYEGERYLIEIGTSCYYEDVLGNTSSDYETVYIDITTFKEVSGDELCYYPTTDDNTIENTDLTYKYNEGIIEFYNGSTLLYSWNDIYDYLVEKKSLTGNYSVSMGSYDGASGNLFISVWSALEDSETEYYTLMLSKADNYSLDKATLLEKSVRSWRPYLGGIISFDDDTWYFNGKTYDADTSIRTFYQYDTKLGTYDVGYYALLVTKDDTVISTLYDKNHTEIAKVSEDITGYTENGHIITMKTVESEDGSYEDIVFGCKYIKKTLVSSEDVLEELGKVEEGDSVEVEIKKNDPVKAEVFDAIKGKDIDLVIKTPSGITWTINGKNVTGTALTDIDLTVDIVENVVPSKVIEALDFDGEKIEISLAHSGDFGFTATLTINVKTDNAGKYANLFYYNPKTGELEFYEASKIDENGNAAFKYTHASDYVIVMSDVAYEASTDTPASPDTADMANVGMLVVVLVVAGAVVVMQKKRISVK